MPALIDLRGQRFGHLVVLDADPVKKGGRHHHWQCQCDCGRTTLVATTNLRRGLSQSCGCGRRTTHGCYGTPEYHTWNSMTQRCLNPKNDGYALYGGRGISVCERWVTSFEAFLGDVGPRPSPHHSLDRYPNRDGNYEPGNVRWATPTEQANNMRTNIYVTWDGRTQTIAQWAREVGVHPNTLQYRLAHWSIDEVFSRAAQSYNSRHRLLTYQGRTQNIRQWSRELSKSEDTIRERLERGWSVDDALGRPVRQGHYR